MQLMFSIKIQIIKDVQKLRRKLKKNKLRQVVSFKIPSTDSLSVKIEVRISNF